MLQNQPAWFLIGLRETGKEFETYPVGQKLNLHEMLDLFNQNYISEVIRIFKLKYLTFVLTTNTQ